MSKYHFPIGKNIRVIDPFTIKPLDASTILASARATGGRIITVEDHYYEGEVTLFTCMYLHNLTCQVSINI